MNVLGKKIYYDIATGDVLVDTGERIGSVTETTIDQDIATYKALNERVRESFDVIQLNYGDYSQEFIDSKSYRINPATKEIEFNYDTAFDLEQYKIFKIEELTTKCDKSIDNGFISQINGHHYRTTADDQLNFFGQKDELTEDETITIVMWKTEDAGYIEHTRENWLAIFQEGRQHKKAQLFKLDQLRQQVNACTTKEEVEAIAW